MVGLEGITQLGIFASLLTLNEQPSYSLEQTKVTFTNDSISKEVHKRSSYMMPATHIRRSTI